MRIRCAISAAFVGLIGLAPVRAAVRPADRAIIDTSTTGITQYLTQYAGIPDPPRTERDVSVLIRAGGAYTNVVVLAHHRVRPEALAAALESSLRHTRLAGRDVLWSVDPPYSAAQIVWSRGPRPTINATNTVPIGAITDGLRSAGYVPQVMLGVARHAHRTDAVVGTSGTYNYCYSNATHVRTAVIEARLTPLCGAFVAGQFLLPLLALVLAVAGVRRAQRTDVALEARRRAYRLRTTIPVTVMALAQPVLVIGAVRGREMNAVSDVLLGSTSRSAALLAGVVASGIGFLIFTITSAVGRRLFAPAMMAAGADMSPEEQRLRTSQTIWTEGAKALVLVLVMVASTVVRSGRLKGGAVKAVEWIAVVAVSILVPLAFQKKLAAYERRTQDEALTKRAQALAVGQGVTIGVVRIDEGLAGRQHILAIRTKGVIVVTRRAADTLSPEEMDFLIARTLVSASSPSGLLYSLFLMASCVPFLVAAFWCFRHPEAFRWGVRYLPILLVAQFGVMYALRPLRERNLHAIDRRALKLTMKAEAAVSAIRKITAPAASAGAPVAAPRTTARLRALLASAHDLGLPISELDTAGTFTSASQA